MIKTYTEVAALPENCVAILKENGRDNFFLGYDWFRVLTETTLEPAARLRIYVVEDAAGTPAMMLMARTPAGQNGSMLHGTPGPRSLSSLTNYQSDIFTPIVASHITDIAPLCARLTAHIASEQPRWDVVDFNYMESATPGYEALRDGFRKAGFGVVPYFHCGYPYEDTDGLSFESYLARRPEPSRRMIQGYSKKARKLERTRKVRYEVYRDMDIETGLGDYLRVYGSSWKQPEPYPEYVPRLFRAAARAGALRLALLYLDDEPVATEAAIVSGGRAVLIKTAYDQKYRDLSVGSIVMLHMMQQLLDVDHARQITRGPFDAPFKSMWLSQRRQLNGIAAYNWATLTGSSGFARQLTWASARAARRVLKPYLVKLRSRSDSG